MCPSLFLQLFLGDIAPCISEKNPLSDTNVIGKRKHIYNTIGSNHKHLIVSQFNEWENKHDLKF